VTWSLLYAQDRAEFFGATVQFLLYSYNSVSGGQPNMGQMGKYCKAYPIAKLRQFPDWKLNAENLRKERKQVDGKEVEVTRELPDDGYLYLQENYLVTDGIFLDRNVVFDFVTDEWVLFCKETLKFEAPV
jgi:hypothetical protein